MRLWDTFIAHLVLNQIGAGAAHDELSKSNTSDPGVRGNLTKIPDNTFTQEINGMSQSKVKTSHESTLEGEHNPPDLNQPNRNTWTADFPGHGKQRENQT